MIKKIRIISLISVILMLLTTSVLAAGPQITMEGENTAKPGETKTITVKIASPDIEVGVVSGKIEKNTNVESMTVTSKNNWTLTYNQSTGVFNIYKAEGAKTEEILNIEYKLKNEEGTAKITISDIDLTTIDYETAEVASISKEITVVAEPDGNEPDDNKPEDNKPDDNKPDDNKPDDNKPDDNKPEDNKPEDNKPDDNKPEDNKPEDNKPDDKEQEDKLPTDNKDDKEKPTKLPETGVANYIIISVTMILVAFISYKKYNQYKNI